MKKRQGIGSKVSRKMVRGSMIKTILPLALLLSSSFAAAQDCTILSSGTSSEAVEISSSR